MTGKVREIKNGGHYSSCVYHSNRDCFSHVTRDTKPPKTPHDQYRLVDWYNQRANDVESTYSTLLNQVNCVSLYNKRIHNMLILLYKSLFLTKYPIYMRNMFTFRTTSYNLRGNYILALPVPKTTSYGLRSFSYHAVKLWNSLPDSVRTLNLTDFKKALAALKLM